MPRSVSPSSRPARTRRAVAHLLATTVLASGLAACGLLAPSPAEAGMATPGGLTASIEAPQPYVGQSTCDPVAKPGVSAFRDLLLRTYRDTGSYGIVVDCGGGGQSEHKEGRAFDWKVSIHNPSHVAEVKEVLAWLTATDAHGNKFAMARRLGIMYMIWNRQMWRSYEDGSWRAYSGVSAHTDHVHFSFGWNGARKTTSYWDGSVAPIDYGPGAAPVAPSVPPFRAVGNLKVLRENGRLSLREGATGEAVKALQRGLRIAADGRFGSGTATAVRAFQHHQRLPGTAVWGPGEWRRLFLPPINPFGQWSTSRATPGATLLTGWVLDADTRAPLSVGITVAGTVFTPRLANVPRPDVARSYPATGALHGFALALKLPDGTHRVCLTGRNASGTPGVNAPLGCRSVVVKSGTFGAPPVATQVLQGVTVRGWALDTASAQPVQVALSLDGGPSTTVLADAPRPEIGATWTGFGADHGYAVRLPLTDPITPGTHRVCATALRVSGSGSTNLGCQSFTMRDSGIGALEQLRQTPAGVHATGWALDPDSADPVGVALTVKGRPTRRLTAAAPRADIAAAHPANGARHGWATTWPLPAGTHQVCAYAANAAGTPGTGGLLGCRAVTVRTAPLGQLTAVRPVPGRTVPAGTVAVTGWQLDPDRAGPGTVELSTDGRRIATLVADRNRPDIGAAHPGYGNAHGFSGLLRLVPGVHRVCATGLNTPGTPGSSTALGCRAVTVASTVGSFDRIKGGTGAIEARGWAIDPDVTGPIRAVVHLDGVPIRSDPANRDWPGLGTSQPGYGSRHGWVLTVTARPGTHRVCVTAVNAPRTPGVSSSLGCRSVRVR